MLRPELIQVKKQLKAYCCSCDRPPPLSVDQKKFLFLDLLVFFSSISLQFVAVAEAKKQPASKPLRRR
jgi:hypothetical protein